MSGKQVIVAEGKHGNDYFDASTPELAARAYSIILGERKEIGYFWREYEGEITLTAEQQEILDMTNEQIDALPSSLRASTKERKEKIARGYAAKKRRKEQEDQWFHALDLVLAVPTEESYKVTTEGVPGFERGRVRSLAAVLVESRTDGEYENVYTERLR
jgi:hypothetical protein